MSHAIFHRSYEIWHVTLYFSLWSVAGQVLRLPLRRFLFLFPPQIKKQRRQSSQSHGAEDSQHAHHDQTVSSALRVVLIAVENDPVGERSDLSGRSVNHSEAQVARSVFDPVKIT